MSIGFDDITLNTASQEQIPNGYQGFQWNNAWVMHESIFPDSGFEHGVVSGEYVAYGRFGDAIDVSATPFSVAGFHATAGFNVGVNAVVRGFVGNVLQDSYQFTLGHPQDDPIFINLYEEGDFKDLTRLQIATTSFGTPAGVGGNAKHIVIDDLLIYQVQ